MNRFASVLVNVAVISIVTLLTINEVAKVSIIRDGGYTEWSEFSVCSKSCGRGYKHRQRYCTNPKPSFGGRNCSYLGKPYQIEPCNTRPCPVDGAFGPWSQFNRCSVSCGGGTHERIRFCNNPSPTYGGKDCKHLGEYNEVKKCNDFSCPRDQLMKKETVKRKDEALWRSVNGDQRMDPMIFGQNKRHQLILAYLVDGGFSNWGEWGDCSATCGGGQRLRTRKCDSPTPAHGGKECDSLGPKEESEECNKEGCPINGSYSEWGPWSKCDMNCGGGNQIRTRTCTNPKPQNGGKTCEEQNLGNAEHRILCNTQQCDVNGGYSNWSVWSSCSATCGGGRKERKRTCTNPKPQGKGKSCIDQELGGSIEIAECNIHSC